MKRIVSKKDRGKRAYAVLMLCATTAMALPAQTFATLHSFDYTDGVSPIALRHSREMNRYVVHNTTGHSW
jgi:hypothetical protein